MAGAIAATLRAAGAALTPFLPSGSGQDGPSTSPTVTQALVPLLAISLLVAPVRSRLIATLDTAAATALLLALAALVLALVLCLPIALLYGGSRAGAALLRLVT